MPAKNIHLIRAAQAKPFVETAARLGAPVEALALGADLPLDEARSGEGVIGEPSLWRFVEFASEHPGCEQLGYLTALDHPVTRTAQLGAMRMPRASTLEEILRIFCREVVQESDGSRYRVVSQNGGIWFTRELMLTDSPAGWQAEQYVLTFVIQIIRLCAPGDWLPRRIRIATQERPTELPAEWSSIHIDWGWKRTELFIDDEVLDLEPRVPAIRTPVGRGSAQAERGAMEIADLVDRQIWGRQTGLDGAARELGMSSSTLKRRLAGTGTSYSEILQDRRMHHATRLLDQTEMSVGKIAEALGYTAVSNFSRAFKIAQGISPRGFLGRSRKA
jgi:AraC-like DNA-binding protein